MSKNKLVIPSQMYTAKKDDYDVFSLLPEPSKKELLSKMLCNENNSIILNFDDKKDRRRTETKHARYGSGSCRFLFERFNLNNYTQADFTFNQSSQSDTCFSITLSSHVYQSNIKKPSSFNNTFTFNGHFDKFYLNYGHFKNFIICENNKVIEQDGNNSAEIRLSDSDVENIKISNKSVLGVKDFCCGKLETLDLSNNSRVHLDFSHDINLRKLKSLNLENCKRVSIDFNNYQFGSLNLEKYSPSSNFKGSFKAEYLLFGENFNLDCVFTFSPDTELHLRNMLPANKKVEWSESAWAIKDLMPIEPNTKIVKLTLLDIFKLTQQKQKEMILQNIQYLEDDILAISKDNKVKQINKEK